MPGEKLTSDGDSSTALEDGSLWLKNIPHTVSANSSEVARREPDRIITGRSVLTELRSSLNTPTESEGSH